MAAAARCAARKPVIVIKAGRSKAGQRATLSHTGSLAGSDAVYDAALRQCGAIRVESAEELFDLCRGLVGIPGGIRGRRVAIVTNSGGPSILAADRGEALGLDVAEPGPAIRAGLAAFLPPHAALKNPIDLTVEGTERGYREALLALLGDAAAEDTGITEESRKADGGPAGSFDAVLAINIAPPYLDSIPLARGICEAAAVTGKPIVASLLPEGVTAEAAAYLQAHGVCNFPTPERAVAVLARMAAHSEAGSRIPASGDLFIQPAETGAGRWDAGNRLPALEPEVMDWLGGNGIAIPPFQVARTAAEAVSGCAEIGYPAVMKVVSPHILHKSERGGVIVGIGDDGRGGSVQVIRERGGRTSAGSSTHGRRGRVLVASRDRSSTGDRVQAGRICTELLSDVVADRRSIRPLRR
jgi:acetyltransferase